MNLLGKKLLILGGKPIGSIELVTRAKELGLYVIVTDYLPVERSPAKAFGDEVWDISTAEVDILVLVAASPILVVIAPGDDILGKRRPIDSGNPRETATDSFFRALHLCT